MRTSGPEVAAIEGGTRNGFDREGPWLSAGAPDRSAAGRCLVALLAVWELAIRLEWIAVYIYGQPSVSSPRRHLDRQWRAGA